MIMDRNLHPLAKLVNRRLQDGKTAAFQRYGGMTIKWLKLVAEDLVMALPENKQSPKIYSFAAKRSPGSSSARWDWQERHAMTVHRFPGPEVPPYIGVTNSCNGRTLSLENKKAR